MQAHHKGTLKRPNGPAKRVLVNVTPSSPFFFLHPTPPLFRVFVRTMGASPSRERHQTRTGKLRERKEQAKRQKKTNKQTKKMPQRFHPCEKQPPVLFPSPVSSPNPPPLVAEICHFFLELLPFPRISDNTPWRSEPGRSAANPNVVLALGSSKASHAESTSLRTELSHVRAPP